jgi:thiosulfate dehydrogenase
MKAPTIRASALLALALTAFGCPEGEPEIKIVQGTAIDHGEALFHDPSIAKTSFNTYSCATCHEALPGDAGDAILTGAPLAGATRRPSYWGGQELDLLAAINHCLYYFMLKDEPWTADDIEARAMYAYLESLPSDGAAAEAVPYTPVYALSDAPPGDAGRGAGLYDRACASCHGPAHSGAGRLVDRAPVLPEQTLEEHPLGEYTELERRLVFVEKVRHGSFVGYGGQMPPFAAETLSDQDIGDLITFMGVP